MIEKIRKWLLPLVNLRTILLLTALQSVVCYWVMPKVEADLKTLSGGHGVLDYPVFYSVEKVRTWIESYGPEGRKLYLYSTWTADLIYPTLASLLFALLFLFFDFRKWWLFSGLVLVLDLLENGLISWLLLRWPQFDPLAARLMMGTTWIYWTWTFVCMGMASWYGLPFLWRKWVGRG